jgi:hypothetical protein
VNLDRKIRQWKDGPLRLYALNPRVDDSSDLVPGPDWRGAVYLERRYLGRRKMVRFGDGYALHPPPYEWTIEELKVTLAFEVRNDRFECVAVTSWADGPELTQSLLRRVNVLQVTRGIAAAEAYRLELDEKGEVIGVHATSPRTPSEAFAQRDVFAATADELGRRVRRPGRPPVSDAELEKVAQVVRDAETLEKSTIAAVAAEFHLSTDAAKKRIGKARKGGFLPPTKRKGNDDG